MKVVHFGMSMNYGGIERYVKDLALYSKSNNIDVSFIQYGQNKIAYNDFFLAEKFNVFQVPKRKDSYLKNFESLYQLFKNNNFDILHIHVNTLSYILPIFIALYFKSKVILHSRNSKSNKSIFTVFLHYLNFVIVHFLPVERIAVSEISGKWLFGCKKYMTINNGIAIDSFIFQLNLRNQTREILNIQNKILVGHVGVFTYAKNHLKIIEVFKSLNAMNSNTVLLLIGDGPLKPKFMNLAKKSLPPNSYIFLPFQDNLIKYYSSMDLFLFPSFYEGFPNVILEAQLAGLPIIMSDKITKEVIISNLCKQVSLKESSKSWALTIMDSLVSIEKRMIISHKDNFIKVNNSNNFDKIRTIYEL